MRGATLEKLNFDYEKCIFRRLHPELMKLPHPPGEGGRSTSTVDDKITESEMFPRMHPAIVPVD